MSRFSLFLLSLILVGGYLVALGWFGNRFISYAWVDADLSLEKHAVQQVPVGDSVTLELAGTGFDKSTRVQMHMDVNNQDAIVGSFPLDGIVNDMLLEENLLYFASIGYGLQILDVSDPLAPKVIRSILPRNTVLDIEKSGSYYILSCGAQGLYFYRKSTAGKFHQVKHLYSLGAAIESRVVDNFLYVATGRRGVAIYDLNKPDEDQPVDVIDVGGLVVGIETYQDRLYLAAGAIGVQVFQIKEPGKLLYVGNLPVEKTVRDLQRDHDKLYLVESNKIEVYQLGQSLMPELRDPEIYSGNPGKIYNVDQTIYISDSRSGIKILDLTPAEPANPIRFIGFNGDPRAMVSAGPYLYVAVSRSGLKIIDQRLLLPRQVALEVASKGRISELYIKDRWLYFADSNGGLRYVSLDQMNSPPVRLIDGFCRSFSVLGDMLYAAKDVGGIEVFSLEDPAAPKRIAQWPELRGGQSFSALDQYMVYAKGADGLILLDVSDLNQPVILDSLTGIHALKLQIENGLVYVAGEKAGVLILRISAQGKLEQVGKIESPFPLNDFSEAMDLQVKEGIAYIANGRGGLLIANVQNPQQPEIVSSVGLPGISASLLLEGERVYISSPTNGLHIVDVSNLKKPQLETNIAISGLSTRMQIEDGLLFLGNGYSGITAIPLPQQIKDFEVVSAEKLHVTLPAVKIPGRYSLQVNNRQQSAVLGGVVRYQPAQNL